MAWLQVLDARPGLENLVNRRKASRDGFGPKIAVCFGLLAINFNKLAHRGIACRNVGYCPTDFLELCRFIGDAQFRN